MNTGWLFTVHNANKRSVTRQVGLLETNTYWYVCRTVSALDSNLRSHRTTIPRHHPFAWEASMNNWDWEITVHAPSKEGYLQADALPQNPPSGMGCFERNTISSIYFIFLFYRRQLETRHMSSVSPEMVKRSQRIWFNRFNAANEATNNLNQSKLYCIDLKFDFFILHTGSPRSWKVLENHPLS